jgi:hypothetical protein
MIDTHHFKQADNQLDIEVKPSSITSSHGSIETASTVERSSDIQQSWKTSSSLQVELSRNFMPKPSAVKDENNVKSNQKNKRRKAPPDITEVYTAYEEHIRVIPNRKAHTIRQDLRVILPDLEYDALKVSREHNAKKISHIAGLPEAYIETVETLKHLPLFKYYDDNKLIYPTLHDTMFHLQNIDYCKDKPIFLSMASVGDDLYWQLIENYIYTMVKFRTIQCTLVICVSDKNCMKQCQDSYFPCYNFHSDVIPLPSVMEQIAEVKLYHVPKALDKGVNVFMLDLDVGFLYNPMVMVKAFMATPDVDIFVQEVRLILVHLPAIATIHGNLFDMSSWYQDMIFIMNRTKAGWKTWYTEPLPNIGLFLCRGNKKTSKVFSMAWERYQNVSVS